MANDLIPDELWKLIEPYIPKPNPRRRQHPGRNPLDPRQVLVGIVFVLRSGIPWNMLPKEMGCGAGSTCWTYLRNWQKEGVWQNIFEVLLDNLREKDKIDFSRAIVDSGSVRAVFGGKRRDRALRTGANWAASTTSSRMQTAFR